jgi:hypothetical protein
VTCARKFHWLGTDKEKVRRQYRFLLTKHDLSEPIILDF